jgi:hypothetical protein
MPKSNATNINQEILEGAPLRYAPQNELGVVFLFSHLAKKWRIHIDSIQSSFPDCIAYQKIQGAERRIRIEFEFKSRNFKTHGHDPRKCDCIVCWEHDWPDAPANLQIIELRKEFGLGFNVWIMPVNAPYQDELEEAGSRYNWSVPSQSHKGDLILFYFTKPEHCIKHIFVLEKRAEKVKATFKSGQDYMTDVKRVCTLKSPIFFQDMQRDKIIRTASFMRAQLQGRRCATEFWPYLHDMIVRRNPSVAKLLSPYIQAD